jgi:carboxypeptidase family protein
MRRLSVVFFLLALLVPSVVRAQATLAGVVRDSSDAVLPGVTVDASSPVLIEKARSAVTDGSGQYRITELPPGTYTLTVTLSGFSTVKREGVEVTGSGVFAINIAMKVGTVAETITVTGETPVVDTQSARRQAVLSNDIIKALPATRSYGALLTAIPGVMVDNTVNNGAMTTPFMTFFSANGGRSNEGRMMLDGLNVAASFNGGGVSTFIYDVANTEEMQVSVSGSLGEAENGGPQVNLVPKSGGNTYNGSFFYQGAGGWSSDDNLTEQLKRPLVEGGSGLTLPASVISSWDANGSGGGPIKRDKLWFYGNLRKYSTLRPVPGAYANLNAGDASKWLFVRDPNVEVRNADSRAIESIRLTSQLTARNRVSFSHEHQHRCSGSTITLSGEGCRTRGDNWVAIGNTTTAPESFPGYHDFPYNVTQATWTSPVTSRLLLEAGYSRFQYLWAGFGIAPADSLNTLIPVTETTTMYGQGGYSYRGLYDPLAAAYADNDASPTNWRATASYVTGAHNMKIGYQGSYQKSLQGRVANQTQLNYRFNGGVPNGFGYYIAPRWEQNDRTATGSLFVQDQWTKNRLTLQGALRYDRAWSFAPADGNGTTLTSVFSPKPITFDRTVSVAGYNDITPRMGAAYDVFGNGKTAIKMNLGKYLQAATNDENYWANNPAGRIVTRVAARGWVDGNGNYKVDCDVSNPARQNNLATGGDDCASLGGNDLLFGSANPNSTIVNPAILEGWGIRPSDWGFGVSLQQELVPRVAVNVGYNRRSLQNFFVTDNTATVASDYTQYGLTVPQNPLLPGAGSTANYYNITPAASARPAQNYQTFETDYAPARVTYWHGFDANLNARLRGFNLSGGTTTGRGVRDTCALFKALPEIVLNQRIDSCAVTEPWMTTIRGLVAYTVPKVDIAVSANVRSVPNAALATASNGSSRNANAPVPNTVVQQTLGRLPANGLANGTTTLNLLNPAVLYGARITQVDMRFGKIVRFSRFRAEIGADLLNLFNTSDVTGYIETFDWSTNGATWLRPNAIVAPRFVRFNLRVDF